MMARYIATTEIQHGVVDASGRHKRFLFKTGAIVTVEAIGVDSLNRLIALGAVAEVAEEPEQETETEEPESEE